MFDVFSNCLNPDSVEERVEYRIDDPSSEVTYFFKPGGSCHGASANL
jgi:hypothetical protein